MWPERPLHQPLRWRRRGGLGAKQSAEQRNPARRSNETCPDEPIDLSTNLGMSGGEHGGKFHGGIFCLHSHAIYYSPGMASLALCALS